MTDKAMSEKGLRECPLCKSERAELLGDTATYSADEWEAVVSYLDQSPFPGAKQVAVVAKTSHRIGQQDAAAKVMADYIEGERQ